MTPPDKSTALTMEQQFTLLNMRRNAESLSRIELIDCVVELCRQNMVQRNLFAEIFKGNLPPTVQTSAFRIEED